MRAIVSAVSPNWQVGAIDEKILAIMVPHDQLVSGVSKTKFANLLDFAEEKLEMQKVLAVFEKSRINPAEGFPKTLRQVGFHPYGLHEHPESLPFEKYFIMCYKF